MKFKIRIYIKRFLFFIFYQTNLHYQKPKTTILLTFQFCNKYILNNYIMSWHCLRIFEVLMIRKKIVTLIGTKLYESIIISYKKFNGFSAIVVYHFFHVNKTNKTPSKKYQLSIQILDINRIFFIRWQRYQK